VEMGPHLLLRGDAEHGLFYEVRQGPGCEYVNGVTGRYLDYVDPVRWDMVRWAAGGSFGLRSRPCTSLAWSATQGR
jgi:hypothetical protein